MSDVIRHSRTSETLKKQRITPKFGRLANVTAVASVDTSSCIDLPSIIRKIVREELLHREEVCRRTPGITGACSPREMTNKAVSTAWPPTVHAATVEYRSTPLTRGSRSYRDPEFTTNVLATRIPTSGRCLATMNVTHLLAMRLTPTCLRCELHERRSSSTISAVN